MKSTTSILVSIFFIFRLSALDLSNAELETSENSNLLAEKSSSTDEHKLLLECQHPDYRTYIKCLKRQKRHHHHSDHDSEGGETRRCFDDCGMDQCESTKCVHDCHKRCMKKTKETRQIITQYETTCGSDDCSEKSEREELPTTNVTTNIDINNVIHNHMPQKPAEEPSSPGSNQPGSNHPGSNGPGSNPPGHNPSGPNAPGPGGFPNWPCGSGAFGCDTSLSLVPQIQFVPQITFGLGIQQSAPSNWLTQQPGRIDCSACGIPWMRYRCDVSCYPMQPSGLPNAGRASPSNCIAPHCVGGT